MKRLGCIFFSVLVLGIGGVWLVSRSHTVSFDGVIRQHEYYVAARGGILSLTIFPTVAEEEGYSENSWPLWPAAGVSLALAVWTGWGWRAATRDAHARGFPVTPAQKEEPADFSTGS